MNGHDAANGHGIVRVNTIGVNGNDANGHAANGHGIVRVDTIGVNGHGIVGVDTIVIVIWICHICHDDCRLIVKMSNDSGRRVLCCDAGLRYEPPLAIFYPGEVVPNDVPPDLGFGLGERSWNVGIAELHGIP